MDKNRGRVDINLKASVCTESPTGIDIFPFEDKNATAVTQTGIERQGGLTPIYEQETTYSPATKPRYVSKSGKVISCVTDGSGDKSNIYLDSDIIGSSVNYGVYSVTKIPNVDDVLTLVTGGYLTVKNTTDTGTTYFVLTVYGADGAFVSTRTLNFGSGLNITGPVSFIRYGGVRNGTDAQEFAAIAPTEVLVLRETGLSHVHSTYTFVGSKQNQLSAYRFENLHYVMGMPGITGSYQVFTNADVKEATVTTGSWMIPQYANFKSRAVFTHVPAIVANNIQVVSLVGYTDFAAWTLGPTFETTTADASAILGYTIGYGYADVRYNRTALGTNIYQIYMPGYNNQHGTASLVITDNTGGTNTDINGYGKLLGLYSNAYYMDLPVQIRMGFIGGVQSYLSAAWEYYVSNVTYEDSLGVMLTNVGEIDNTYLPYIYPSSTYVTVTIVYKYNGNFYCILIANHTAWTGSKNVMQEISPNLYKLNTISPHNVIDVNAATIEVGSVDYNGRMKFKGLAPEAVHKWSAIIQGRYAQGIDTGDKLPTQSTTVPPILPGTAIPAVCLQNSVKTLQYSVDVYYDDVYWRSVGTEGGYTTAPSYAIPSKANLLYVPDLLLPVAMGSTYAGNFTARTKDETLFLQRVKVDYLGNSHEFDGYLIGNNVYGVYDSFTLFGQIYLFDGLSIWAATFNGNAYQSRDFVCSAQGMVYVASAPTQIYFLSSFDNSLYTFDGGRSLTKAHRFSDEATITDGVYSTIDNTLLLQTATTFVWVRDDVISVNAKKTNQTATALYTTSAGVVISNNVNKWIYGYLPLSSSTVVPFTYQGSYFGFGTEAKSATVTYHVTLYSPTKAAADITLVCYAFDETEYTTQTEYLHVNAGDWALNGFYRCRIQPKNQKAVAASVGVAFTTKLVLVRVSVEYAADEAAVTAGARSR